MTLSIADRVFETSATQGTGTLSLNGAVTGFRSFVAAVGTNKKVPYVIDDGISYEIGIGTVISGTPDTLQRTTILKSSNSDAAVNFASQLLNVRLAPISLITASRDENLNFIEGFGSGGGAGNTHTLTLPVAPLAYSDGMKIRYFSTVGNTGAMTINVNGLGAKICKVNGASVPSGFLSAGLYVEMVYKSSTGFFEIVVPTVALEGVAGAKTATYTATVGDTVIPCDTSAGAFTINLYSAIGNTGKRLSIVKTDGSFNAVTIDPNASEMVGGSSTTTLNTQGETITLISNGANWIITNRHGPSEWVSFTPTIGVGSGALSNNANTGKWRRVGDSIEVMGEIAFSGAPSAFNTVTVNLPAGLSPDTGKLPGASFNSAVIGQASFWDNGVNLFTGSVFYNSTGSPSQFVLYGVNAASANANVVNITNTVPLAFGANDAIFWNFKVPVTGWKG